MIDPAAKDLQRQAACYVDSAKETLAEHDFTDEHWFKDQTIYYTVDQDGFHIASDDEVTEYKQWQEDAKESRERAEHLRLTPHN